MAGNCCGSGTEDQASLNDPRWRLALWIALIVNAAMFIFEFAAGAAADSRALQADALDFFGDSANYAISLVVAGMALTWRARTAFLKGLTLLAFGSWVLVTAILAFHQRHHAACRDDGRRRRNGAGRQCRRCLAGLTEAQRGREYAPGLDLFRARRDRQWRGDERGAGRVQNGQG